jgi:hypothetical protein
MIQRLEMESTRLKDEIMVVKKDMQYDIFHQAEVVSKWFVDLWLKI